MANKVPWYQVFDWKSVTGLLLVLGVTGIFISIYYLPDIIRNSRLKTYKGEVYGYIIKVEENLRVTQSDEGNKRSISSFTLGYSFETDGLTYTGQDDLKATPVNTVLLSKTLKLDSGRIKIRYDQRRPEKSLLVWD